MISVGEQVRRYLDQCKKLCEAASELLKRQGHEAVQEDAHRQEENAPPTRFKTLKEMRVAAIMDRFTLDSYAPECQLLELTPAHWREEIEQFKPDLVFIESAWKGKDDLWYRKIANGSKEFFEMADYCHAQEIPIVFWNKEDPIYTTTFLPVAQAADVVFTTDMDCVEQYKTALGHDRVYHLHFAAQPTIHNPIEKYERKNKFCFAGAYYHRYPKRAQVFDAFAEVFSRREGLDIYDRNYQSALPEHAFPERYNSIILGKLDPSEIDVAYKGYVYGINMNSVNQSQTMFARRVFELLACNTIVVGNYARGLKNYFGDLTICTDDARVLESELNRYAGDETTLRKYRLAGLRSALSHHLYVHRLAYIVKQVFGRDMLPELPTVHVFAKADSAEQAQRLMRMYKDQCYEHKRMTLFADGVQADDEGITVLPLAEAQRQKIGSLSTENEFVAAFSEKDWYGKNYLLDLMLTLRYGAYEGMGKAAMFVNEDNGIACHGRELAYRPVEALCTTASAIHRAHCTDLKVKDFCKGQRVQSADFMAVDEFNYCKNWEADTCEVAADLVIADQGILPEEIDRAVRSIRMSLVEENESVYTVESSQIAQIPLPKDGTLTFTLTHEGTELASTLPADKHVYIWKKERIAIGEYMQDGKLPIIFRGTGDLDTICACVFYDQKGQKIAPLYPKMNRHERLVPPAGAVSVQLGFRPKGSGKILLRQIMIGGGYEPDRLATFLSRSDTLVLTNHYPSYDNLYRNMFVHKRMTSYKDDGVVCDVFRMNINVQSGYREFEGINVIDGHAEELEKILSSGRIKTVCVHFIDEMMWSVLKNHLYHIRVIIWLHGAGVQPWWRRTCNYRTNDELEAAKKASEKMMSFWKEVFATDQGIPIHYVFVSQYLANEVMEDHQIQLRKDQYSIIHNCIDTEMFTYEKKDPEQRKRILTIKPFASRIYGNDITTRAIVALSKEPIFKDLDISIYGDGVLFDEENAPLKKFSNVHLHKQFLTQDQIAQLHKAYGVYIATKRMDTQGVSRDEAMSSGLVPIASNVAAIPEFVDENCGILVPGEEHMPIVEAIKRLYNDPALFERLSENAAKRVRSQTSRPYTIRKELELIGKQ